MTQTYDPESFYALFAAVCRERGVKPGAVLKIAKLTPQAGESWKRATAPKYETKVKLAKALGVPVSRFQREGELHEAPPLADVSAGTPGGRYPSLVEFLRTTPHIEEERLYLERQQFLFGDPGQDTWTDLLDAYRKAKKRASQDRLPAIVATPHQPPDRSPRKTR